MRLQSVLLVGAAVMAVPLVSVAAPVNYGDKVATDLIYRQVTEDSNTDPTPLYGTPSTAGNSLIFNPVSFGASSSNGAAPDITDGTLTTTIEAKPGKSIVAVNISEAGDYTLGGSGNSSTNVSVSAPYFLRITEVDGVSINPISLSGNLAFSPSGGTYELPGEAGVGVIWTGSASVNVADALAANNITGKATKATFSMDNVLLAFSQPGSLALIKKKQIGGTTVTIIVPEPAALTALAGVSALSLRRRRR